MKMLSRCSVSRHLWEATVPCCGSRYPAHLAPLSIRLHQSSRSIARHQPNHSHILPGHGSQHRNLSARPSFVPSTKPARYFSTTHSLSRDHHFDTLKFVQRLKDEGFSEEQSKAMMLVLSDVIEESIQNLTRTMVLREGPLPIPSSQILPQLSTILTP